jgi:flavin reductase (DIM6/NTAB) family NADH-FMN oxidoreductase RutF
MDCTVHEIEDGDHVIVLLRIVGLRSDLQCAGR